MKILELDKKDIIPFRQYELDDDRQATSYRIQLPQGQPLKFFGNPPADVVYHHGYLNYLAKAWAHHYYAVFSPDHIWFMVINEISAEVAKSPSEYSNLFTTKPSEKQLILVPTNEVESIDPELVVNALKDKVPSNVDDFLPKFSTATPMSTMASNIAFCDVVSPYYNYGTYCCGIPMLRIEGTAEDWKLLLNKLNKLSGLFSGNLSGYLSRCYTVMSNTVKAIENSNVDHFKTMVKLAPCGSGSQYDMSGWILNLLNRKNIAQVQLEGLPPHFAHMNYFNEETQRKFSMYSGIFYSKIESQYLVPVYDAVRYEVFDKLP